MLKLLLGFISKSNRDHSLRVTQLQADSGFQDRSLCHQLSFFSLLPRGGPWLQLLNISWSVVSTRHLIHISVFCRKHWFVHGRYWNSTRRCVIWVLIMVCLNEISFFLFTTIPVPGTDITQCAKDGKEDLDKKNFLRACSVPGTENQMRQRLQA